MVEVAGRKHVTRDLSRLTLTDPSPGPATCAGGAQGVTSARCGYFSFTERSVQKSEESCGLIRYS